MTGPDHQRASGFKGKLLLADPALREGIFEKSVILVAEHSEEEGAFGLVLNHPTGNKVEDVFPSGEFPELSQLTVYAGGPVGQDHLTFAAFWKDGSQIHYRTRVSAEDAIQLNQRAGTCVHAYIGYSGWSQDQLEQEMAHQSWHLSPLTPLLLRKNHSRQLWRRSMEHLSPYHRILSLSPENILAN